MEMIVLHRMNGNQLPTNVLENIQNTYSAFSVQFNEGHLIIKVPKVEYEIMNELHLEIQNIVYQKTLGHNVLAEKQARMYGVKLPR